MLLFIVHVVSQVDVDSISLSVENVHRFNPARQIHYCLVIFRVARGRQKILFTYDIKQYFNVTENSFLTFFKFPMTESFDETLKQTFKILSMLLSNASD